MRCAVAVVPFFLNSKVNFQSLGAALPSAVGGVKVHFRAACSALSAKYSLGPRETKTASDTAPDLSTTTFTVTLTLPVIVFLAFGGTSGKTS